jgi:WD40 repeat protein
VLVVLIFACAALAERNTALELESHFLVRDSQTATNGGDAVTGILLALEVLPKHRWNPFDRPFVSDAGYALENGVANERERMVLRGHDKVVLAVAYAPDGRRFVTSGGDNTVREWDARTGAQLLVMRGHTDWVHGASYSPDGRTIVSASEDRSLRIWDATTGATLHVMRGHEGIVNSAKFSPDGRYIVSGSDDDTVRIWSAKGGGALAVLKGHKDAVYDARFSPDGTRRQRVAR